MIKGFFFFLNDFFIGYFVHLLLFLFVCLSFSFFKGLGIMFSGAKIIFIQSKFKGF